jgi:acetoin utilization deacetylase AcuC-like enzyme
LHRCGAFSFGGLLLAVAINRNPALVTLAPTASESSDLERFMPNLKKTALIYSPKFVQHDAGLIRVEGNNLVHLVNGKQLIDEAYTMDKILYPFALPEVVPHPERAERVLSIYESLQNYGLLNYLTEIEPKILDENILGQTHAPHYIEKVKKFSQEGGCLAEATYVSPGSYETALLSAGGAVLAVEKVMSGEFDNALAMIRPPGHHAGIDHAGGFCLFNNVAIAARYCLNQLGCKRVMIVDWDLHHGDGTQEIFWQDERVLFVSLHQFGKELYPEKGDFHETGAFNNIVNLPLPAKIGVEDYLQIFGSVVPSLAVEYQPDIILVSAGQDGHFGDINTLYTYDPGAGFCLSADTYHSLTMLIADLAEQVCNGRYVTFLEGGYGIQNLCNSVVNIAAAQLGSHLPPLVQYIDVVKPDIVKLDVQNWLEKLKAAQKVRWSKVL